MPAEDVPMSGSHPVPRRAIQSTLAILAVVLLTRCSDTVHGSANANGTDHGSAGIFRLNLPL